jgi:cadmium resistance protein CadD (predicted permease)
MAWFLALVQLFTISAQQPTGTPVLGGKLQRFARPLGAVIIVIGLVVLALGTDFCRAVRVMKLSQSLHIAGVNRYFRIQYALTVNQFPPARKTVAFISTVLVAIVAIVFGVLVGVPRR